MLGASSDLEASVFCGSWRSTSSSAVVFTACGLVLCSRCRVHVQARQNPRRSAALEHLGVHVRCPSLHSGGLFECMRLCALPMPCCSTSRFPALHRPQGSQATARQGGSKAPRPCAMWKRPAARDLAPSAFTSPRATFARPSPAGPRWCAPWPSPAFSPAF